jgi:hypothetical protein
MDHIGIDLHKKESQICILRAEGELIEQRVRTTPARFARSRARKPIAASAPHPHGLKRERLDEGPENGLRFVGPAHEGAPHVGRFRTEDTLRPSEREVA